MTSHTPRQTAEIMARVCITDVAPCGECGSCAPYVVPTLTLDQAVQAVTAALDAEHAAGKVIPPQAAACVAMLDTVAKVLAAQSVTGS
jgi:hypothetical protein